MNRTLPVFLSMVLLAGAPVRAEVQPHVLFSDGAVLQQGIKVPVWGTAADGEKVTVKIQGQEASGVAQGGKWRVDLPPLKAGGPFELTIAGNGSTITIKDVLVGEVWICSGQSNMQWGVQQSAEPEKTIAESANPKIRLFTVQRKSEPEPQSTVARQKGGDGSWHTCGPTSVPSFSAVGYFFGRELQRTLNVPIGLINTSYGGTPAQAWTSRPGLAAVPEFQGFFEADEAAMKRFPEAEKAYKEQVQKWQAQAAELKKQGKQPPRPPQAPMGPNNPHRIAGLYNAMIHPLLPYAIRGAIWYQGESNSGQAYQYRKLFPTMIKDWRTAWGQGDFPFLFVQLAPFTAIVKEPGDSNWAELREAQLLTLTASPNTGMAVITDVGEENDIHPKKKQPVGERLALAARAIAYGEQIEFSGPVYQAMQVKGDKVVLSFSHLGGGLEARGGPLTGFAVCGADKKFVNAYAEIDGQTIVVSSPQVREPIAVRFGWANYPVVNLWNKAGLPATPFRTDDFPGITAPKAQ